MTDRSARWMTAATIAAGLALTAGPVVAASGAVAEEPTACARPARQQSIPAPTGTPWYAARLGRDHVAGLGLGEGQVVAVLDTGVAPVPALAGAFRPGIDLLPAAGGPVVPATGGTTAPTGSTAPDCDGRGTVMAGLVAARRGYSAVGLGLELPGLARAADILPVRVLASARDTVDPVVLAKGMTVAVAAGASVLLVGCAARVAATDPGDSASAVNAVGRVSVGAPGADIVGLGLDGGVVGGQAGSALAAALVAATAADVHSAFPDLHPEQLLDRIRTTADRSGVAVPDPSLGWGVVNPVTALTAPVDRDVPSAAPTAPGAITVALPPEPADNRWAIAVAAMMLVLAAIAAAVVAGARRATARHWRAAGRAR